MLIPGAQWMTALGGGLSAVNGMMSGNPMGAIQGVTQMGKGMQGTEGTKTWMNPAQGNIYQPDDAQASRLWMPYMLEEAKKQTGYWGF
jgi:hypothetical protein